jgi:hypothetical protein
MFRLSTFRDRLLRFYDANPDFLRPASRMAEIRVSTSHLYALEANDKKKKKKKSADALCRVRSRKGFSTSPFLASGAGCMFARSLSLSLALSFSFSMPRKTFSWAVYLG